LVKSNLVQDKHLPPVGMALIRSFLGEPVQAELVAMCIKPAPEAGFEYIGPPLKVTCAVAPLTIESDMILCGIAVQQLEELSEYCVPKPLVIADTLVRLQFMERQQNVISSLNDDRNSS